MDNLLEVLQARIAFALYGLAFVAFALFNLKGVQNKYDNPINRALYLIRIPIAVFMAAACFFMVYLK